MLFKPFLTNTSGKLTRPKNTQNPIYTIHIPAPHAYKTRQWFFFQWIPILG